MLLRLFLLLSLLPCLAVAQPRVVTLAVDDAHPPYAYASRTGQLAGSYLRMLEIAMQELPEWQLRLAPRPWVRALQEARQGTVDGFLPPYRHVERDWVALYVGPLHNEEVVLSCAPGVKTGAPLRWPADFAQRRIGTTRGYLLGAELSELFRAELARPREFRNARDALAALARGEIDCYANDRLDIEHAHAEAVADRVWAARVPPRLEPPHVLWSQQAFLAVSKASLAQRPELADFAQALNARLAQMRSRGDLQRLVDEGFRSASR